MTNWTEAAEAVRAAQRILVASHVAPDGDAIGSLMGVTNALRQMGKHVDAVMDDGVPDYLTFVPGSETVLRTVPENAEYDLFISVDSSDEERTGNAGIYGRSHSRTVMNLDHHATNTGFGDVHLVVPTAVSATEVTFDWFSNSGIEITREVAIALLTGLVTDTIGFRTQGVSARTLEIAQALIQRGASLTEITARTLDTKPYSAITLWKRALQTVTLDDGVIYATITYDDYQQTGVDDDSGLVSFLVRVNEALVAAVFREAEPNVIDLSFRAKAGFDVALTARQLGGGGHTLASGARVEGTLEDVRARVLALLRETVAQGSLVIA
jgi:phosphoesterase RecJ-like protein